MMCLVSAALSGAVAVELGHLGFVQLLERHHFAVSDSHTMGCFAASPRWRIDCKAKSRLAPNGFSLQAAAQTVA